MVAQMDVLQLAQSTQILYAHGQDQLQQVQAHVKYHAEMASMM